MTCPTKDLDRHMIVHQVYTIHNKRRYSKRCTFSGTTNLGSGMRSCDFKCTCPQIPCHMFHVYAVDERKPGNTELEPEAVCEIKATFKYKY